MPLSEARQVQAAVVRTDGDAQTASVLSPAPGDTSVSRPAGPLVSMPGAVAPFVVTAVALAFASASSAADALLAAFVGGVLVVLAAIDLEHRIIPNRIVLPAASVTLLAHIAISPDHAVQYMLATVLTALALFIPRLFNRNAIGMGDVKLGLLMGAALGSAVIPAIALSFFLVFPVALVIVIRGGAAARSATLPMGPFLALGTLIVLLGPGLTGN